MKTRLAAAALAAVIAQPASAVTFPSLTTVYVGAGAFDNGGNALAGTATAIICSNVSGVNTAVRVAMLNFVGDIEAQRTADTVPHGTTVVFVTHAVAAFGALELGTGNFMGAVNIEATQSAVFCTASVMSAAGQAENAKPINLVRVNPHPGTVE